MRHDPMEQLRAVMPSLRSETDGLRDQASVAAHRKP